MASGLDTQPTESGSDLRIKVFNYKRIEAGNLLALCSVDIRGKFKIHGCRIVQQKGQLAWVSLPQREWTDSEGNRRFYPVIELPKHVEHEIRKAVLRGWERFRYATA